jgi:hypothetical protein
MSKRKRAFKVGDLVCCNGAGQAKKTIGMVTWLGNLDFVGTRTNPTFKPKIRIYWLQATESMMPRAVKPLRHHPEDPSDPDVQWATTSTTYRRSPPMWAGQHTSPVGRSYYYSSKDVFNLLTNT